MPLFHLRTEILKEHSKTQCKLIVDWVGASQQRFDELFYLFLNDEYRVVQRAAWPVSYCVEAYPNFIKKHWASLIKNLQKPNLHNAVKRNTIRLLQHVQIPKKHQGAAMDICFKYLENPQEAVAIKAFSLTVLQNVSNQYPEIISEIKYLVEEQLPHQTAAFKARANFFLKKIRQINII